jgi:diguanylate cyclase (GGDEF)-like protein
MGIGICERRSGTGDSLSSDSHRKAANEHMLVTEFLSRQRRLVVILVGVVLLCAVAAGHYLVRLPLLEFSVLYLIPVSFFTWFAGRRWGMLVAFGAAAWTLHQNLASYPMSLSIAYWNAVILLGLYVGATLILGELRTLYLRERDLSRIDYLTQLPNRRAFFEFAEVEISRAQRYNHPLTLVYLDIDEFKKVNDQYGHLVGDEVLRQVAASTQSGLRRSDLAARMGGDEFALLLPETSSDAARPILERIQANLRRAMKQKGQPVTFSIGAVTFHTPPANVDEMIRIGDEQMYQAKGEGKDRVRQKDLA